MVDKYGLTNEHVITIVRCFPSLRSLKLNHCEEVTDKGVSAIARLSMLRELDIGGCDVSDVSVLPQNLESLCLGDFSYGAPKERLLSNATLIAAVRRCPRLLSLDLTCVKVVTDASIAVIAEACPLLKSIDLTMTDNFTDAAIVSLATCRAFAIAQLVVRSPGLVWLSTYNCPGWRDRGGKGHELARLLREHLPNPERSHSRIMQFLPTLTLHS